MKIEKLVKMANQIAVNVAYGPDKNEAAERVCDHLSRFWPSDMRAAIVAYHAQGGAELNDVAKLAVAKLAEKQPRVA